MTLLGAKNIDELSKVDMIIKNNVKDWCEIRNIDYKKFGNRRQGIDKRNSNYTILFLYHNQIDIEKHSVLLTVTKNRLPIIQKFCYLLKLDG